MERFTLGSFTEADPFVPDYISVVALGVDDTVSINVRGGGDCTGIIMSGVEFDALVAEIVRNRRISLLPPAELEAHQEACALYALKA